MERPKVLDEIKKRVQHNKRFVGPWMLNIRVAEIELMLDYIEALQGAKNADRKSRSGPKAPKQ